MIPSSTEARAYLAQHGVIDRLQAEVAKVLKDRPADPIVAIGKALAVNATLTKLDLQYNSIGDEAKGTLRNAARASLTIDMCPPPPVCMHCQIRVGQR